MKRFITLLFAVAMTAMAMATDYTDDLQVSVDGGNPTTVKDVKITVTEQSNGKYTFTLKNFKFSVLNIGDVELTDVEGTEKDGITTLSVTDVKTKVKNPGAFGITINALGGITITMTAKLSSSNNKMYADMAMKAAGQNIKAVYGSESNITTGISSTKLNPVAAKVSEIYTLAGQQIGSMTPGQVYIVKTTDGQTKKMIKK